MPILPGPDRPGKKKVVVRRRVAVAPKKPKKKVTRGNVYTSAPPRPRPTTPPAPVAVPGASQRASLVPGPYDRFKDIPGALAGFAQIAADQTGHQNYVNQTVAPWLTQGLQGLAQFNTDAQNQYMGNVQTGAVGAAIAPNQVSGGPGGIVAGNNSFLTGAGQEYARASGSTAQQIAAYQGAMNKMQSTTLSQGYIQSLADYAKGLPAMYSERRRAFTEKLEGYLAEVQQAQAEAQLEQAEFAEKQRHNKVTEAISATNASTNAAFQASRLGLDANDQAFDQQQDLTAASTPAPAGYLRDPATGKLYRDPSVPQASSSGSGGGGGTDRPLTPSQISSMQGKWKRPKNSPPKLGAGWKQPVWDPGTKAWYAKRGSSGSSGRSTAKPTPYGKLVTDLGKAFNGSGGAFGASGTPGWSETFAGNPTGLRDAMADWVIDNAVSFNTAGGKFDPDKVLRALATLGDGNKKYALIWPILKKRIRNGKLT